MNGNGYQTPEVDEMEDAMEMELIEADDEAYDADEVDDMLDALVESAEADEDLAERRKRQFRQLARTAPVKTASGQSPYRAPTPAGGFVTQKQLSDAMGRVGTDIRRNATGIKTVNTRLNGVVAVNKVQSREIGRLDRQMKMDGVFELVEAYNSESKDIDPYQLLKGVVKSGYLGQSKGALANPLVVGGIGFVLRNGVPSLGATG